MTTPKETSSPPLPEDQPTNAAAWRYVLVDQGLVAILVNFAINWGIAWLVFRKMPVVPLKGDLSITGDTVATCWMLPLISCLIVTSLTRHEIRQGRIPSLSNGFKRVPFGRNLLLRAALWGIVGNYLIAPIAVHGLNLSGIENLPLQRFLVAKALFACALGIFFCPVHAWIALHDGIPRWVRPHKSSHD